MYHHHTRPLAAGLGIALLVALTGACADDTDGAATPDTPTTVATPVTATNPATTGADHGDHGPEPMKVTIGGIDYAFTDVPRAVPAGTQLAFENTSAGELHELVVFRLPDDVDTPLDGLLSQPPADLEAMLGAPVTVILQPPGAEPIAAVGDGTLAEPGRYALLCFIPVGADPAEYLEAVAAAGGGKPEGVSGGPPHFTAGMYAELIVE